MESKHSRLRGAGNNKLLGAGSVTVTSISYGLVPSLSILAFRMGVETETLLFNKFLYASIIMWTFMIIRRIKFKVPRASIPAIVFTCAGYILMSTCMYVSYEHISGSLATIISFTYPAMIVAIEMITGREPVQITKILAVVLSFAGLILIVWSPDMDANMMGIAFAFFAALFYVMYSFGLSAKSLKDCNSFSVAGYVMVSAAGFNLVRCLLSDKPLFATQPAQIGMMLLLSIVCVFLAILCYAIGVKLIGPGNASLINTLEPVLACIFGYLIVDDKLTLVMLIGSAMVVAAVLITNLPGRSDS